MTVSVVITVIAAFSARALPPCGTRSQNRFGYSALGALSTPSAAAVRPKRSVSSSRVASVEPSSAMTICAGPCVCRSSAAIVTGSTVASLCDATITPMLGKLRRSNSGSSGGARRINGSVFHVTNASSKVSYTT